MDRDAVRAMLATLYGIELKDFEKFIGFLRFVREIDDREAAERVVTALYAEK